MANAQSGEDVSQRGPSEYLDPLAPLSSQFQQLKSMMELVFDDDEEFLQELNRDVLALPPEERFTQSHEVLREHIEDQFGSADAFAAVLPQSGPEKLSAFLKQVFDKLLTDAFWKASSSSAVRRTISSWRRYSRPSTTAVSD